MLPFVEEWNAKGAGCGRVLPSASAPSPFSSSSMPSHAASLALLSTCIAFACQGDEDVDGAAEYACVEATGVPRGARRARCGWKGEEVKCEEEV